MKLDVGKGALEYNYENCRAEDDACMDINEAEAIMTFDIPYKPVSEDAIGYIEPQNILDSSAWPIDYFSA